MENQGIKCHKNKQLKLKSILKMKESIVYYIEWKQFTSDVSITIPGNISQNWDAVPSQALIGDINTIIDAFKNFHVDRNPQGANEESVSKPKKRVRFQLPTKTIENAPNCIPDIVHGCGTTPITPNNRQSIINAQGKEGTRSLRKHKTFRSMALPMIKRKIKTWLNKSMMNIESSPLGETIVTGENGSKRRVETSDSYCRHDDTDNVILIDNFIEEWENDFDNII